jgi:hypothetical protein
MGESQSPARIIFQRVRECSAATGVPLEILLRAKNHPTAPRGTNGLHDSGRVYWVTPEQGGNTFKKWVADHTAELESVTGETREHWLTRRDRANALLAELELEEKYSRIVDKQLVKELLERVSAAQVSLFNSKLRQELPARLNLPPEKIAEVDKVIGELFAVMQKGVSQWTQ